MNLPLDSVKMEPCYNKVNLLQEHLQDLKSRFRFPHIDLVVQRTQNYMQEVGAAGSSVVEEDGAAEKQAQQMRQVCWRSWGNGARFFSHHVEWWHLLSCSSWLHFFHVDEHHREEMSQGNRVALTDNYLIFQVSAINVGFTLESSGALLRNTEVWATLPVILISIFCN